MELFLCIALSAGGIFLLAKGGDWFVDSSISLAKRLKVPPLIIGATIVSIGTTLPEIFVSTIAAAGGDTALAMSNATGSILCNLTLILGVTLTFIALTIDKKTYFDKFLFAVLNVLLLVTFILDGQILLFESIILLVVFVAFMITNVFLAKKRGGLEIEIEAEPFSVWTIIFFIVGAVSIALGAKLLVDNITTIATEYLKVPTIIVGATIVALGTSLPELITAITAIRKGSSEMSVGNVLGANVLNGTLILGLNGIIGGGAISVVGGGSGIAIAVAIGVMLVGLAVLILPLIKRQKTMRFQGVTLLALYVGYIGFIIISAVI